ncbi:hypothetical protein NE237_014086 [Protea cynaroides]|uniref:Gnk2-homologous domain-containing protein n=1 Tax=Protea cynaroides TaxID=273540 RepID=A0A9Q0K0S1_9MAGN|nr:hypothetical protein NE237_014086 [Protea cynaroides]
MDNLCSFVNQNGFGTNIAGEGPNVVCALAQCFNDLGSIDCEQCRFPFPVGIHTVARRIYSEICESNGEESSIEMTVAAAEIVEIRGIKELRPSEADKRSRYNIKRLWRGIQEGDRQGEENVVLQQCS